MSTRKKVLIGVTAMSVLAVTLAARAPHFRDRAAMRTLVAGYLDLNEVQKSDAEAIFDAARESAQPVMEQLRQGHEAVRNAIKSGAPEQEVENLASQQGVLMGQVAGIYAKAFSRFYALLTPEQKEKAEKLHDQFRDSMRRRFDLSEK